MAPTLDDAWAKVEWAYRHLVALDELIDPYLGDKPYFVRHEMNAERTHRVATATRIRPVPDDVPNVFGDLVHALHAALDYVVCSAVEVRGKDVRPAHAFPIFPTRTAYESKCGNMLADVPAELIELIESLQPYHEAERAEAEGLAPELAAARAERMPLMRLYRLSIEEKHRALLLSTAVFGATGMYVVHDRSDEEGSGIGFGFSPSYDKAIVTLPIDPAHPNERFNPNFSAKVTLIKDGPHGMGIERVARMLYREVAHRVMPEVRNTGRIRLTNPRDLPFPPV